MQTTLVAVVIGAQTSKLRFGETAKMFNYGFANFQSRSIVSTEVPLVKVELKNATQKEVGAYAQTPYSVFERKGEEAQYNIKYQIDRDIKAPIQAGQKLGTALVLNQNNVVIQEIDLVSAENIDAITIGEILDKIYKNW